MGRVFRPKYQRKSGEWVRSANYHAEWQGADGRTKRKKVGTDRREALEFLVRMEQRENRIRQGLDPEPGNGGDRSRPLQDLIPVYLDVLTARDTDGDYRTLVRDYLTRTCRDCSWHVWADITPDSLLLFLGRRRESAGNGPATLNSYMRVAKGFTNWLAERLDEKPPLKKLKPFPEEVDRRRSKRILTDAEFAALVAATEAGKRRGRQRLSGADRAMLYRVAAYTGVRASELAKLEPSAFDLTHVPPVVTVEAKDSKGKRAEPIPLPAHLVERLKAWLKAKPRGLPVWPGDWAKHRRQVRWLATDLRRAGVAEKDDKGRRCNFHSLKRRYVVRLIQSGANIDEVRRMARHRDVKTTLNYYTDADLTQLGAVADRLPDAG